MSTSRFTAQFDALSQIMLALAFGVGFFSLTFQPSPSEQFFLFFYLLFGVVGIALGIIFAGGKVKSDRSLSSEEIQRMLIYIIVSTAMVYFIATAASYVPGQSYPSILSKAENLIIGVCEELFFSFFLFAWLVNHIGFIPANIAACGVFALFHVPGLGLALGSLLVVFAAKFVMNYTFYLGEGRIAIPIASHTIYNLIVMGI